MRLLPVLSLLAATALSVSPSGAVAAESVTRALAPSESSSSGDTAAAAEALKKYLGNDAANMTEQQVQDKLKQLNEDAKTDSKLADILHKLKLDTQSLAQDAKDWLAKVGDGVHTLLFGKDDNNDDNFDGVFGTVWKSLFGKKKSSSSSSASSSHGSSSGSMDHDAGSGSGSSASVIEQPKASSASQDDTSIQTVAPAPTPVKTVAKTNNGAKLLTSLPLAGTLAAIIVINFVQ